MCGDDDSSISGSGVKCGCLMMQFGRQKQLNIQNPLKKSIFNIDTMTTTSTPLDRQLNADIGNVTAFWNFIMYRTCQTLKSWHFSTFGSPNLTLFNFAPNFIFRPLVLRRFNQFILVCLLSSLLFPLAFELRDFEASYDFDKLICSCRSVFRTD